VDSPINPAYYQGSNGYLKRLVPSAARRILDVGCGAGQLGAELKASDAGVEVWGIEVVPEIAETALQKLDHVIVANLEHLPPLPVPPKYFDCIICGDVIEHLTRPQATLEWLKTFLSDGGLLLCSVPNIGHWSVVAGLLAGKFTYESKGLLDRTHLRFFTAESFRLLLMDSGFGIQHEENHPLPHNDIVEPLVHAAHQLGINPEITRRSLETYQEIYAAKPLSPVIDASTSHLLGPAKSDGVSIVVLTYNSASTIRACSESIMRTLGENDEVIFVDNASQDQTVEILRQLWRSDPQVRFIRNARNLGFSRGSNVGLKATKGRYLCLLNPDTVVYPGWIESLRRRLDDPSVGLVGPLSDKIAGDQFVGHYIRPKMSLGEVLPFLRSHYLQNSIETKLLIGMCVMSRRETLDQVGLLDEDLFLGSDDLELSWRLRTHGLKLVVAPDAFVHHEGGVSFSSEPREKTDALLFDSTEKLLTKVRNYYGWLPTSIDCWGIAIIHAE